MLVDTHVVHWMTTEPAKLSGAARSAIEGAGEVGISAISWNELAWLAQHGRIVPDRPLRAWLDFLASRIQTLPVTVAVAATAVSFPESFTNDPADRLICATAIEAGLPLVTKDRRMRSARLAGLRTIW